METGCAGILSRISRHAEDQLIVNMCGQILNSMSTNNTSSTVAYSEGSIVAVLSMFEERHHEEDIDVVPAQITILGSEIVSLLIVDEVTVPEFEHEKIDPTWDKYLQGGDKVVNALVESKEMVKHVIEPRQIYQLQTAGDFEKIEHIRGKLELSSATLIQSSVAVDDDMLSVVSGDDVVPQVEVWGGENAALRHPKVSTALLCV